MDAAEPVAACCDFGRVHDYHCHPAMREIEREVLGCDFGGTSWTTRDQALQAGRFLGLERGVPMLEIGAGSGWPGLWLVREFDARATLLDVPVAALGEARGRARREGLERRVSVVCGSGDRLPLQDACFEAISHSDVLCCLPGKPEMLAECRRVARDGATMVFFVIRPGEGLSAAERDRAGRVGPPFVALEGCYADWLEAAGWNLESTQDLSSNYLNLLKIYLELFKRKRDALSALMGEDYAREHQHRRDQIEAVSDGLLVREVYHCRAGRSPRS